MSCTDNENRFLIKYSTIPGQTPTIPLTSDHDDNTWNATDLYVGEMFMNSIDNLLWIRTDNGILPITSTGSGTSSFVGDYVHISGGTYSGTVSIPTIISTTGNITHIYSTDITATTFNGSFIGDGSGLTGIVATWSGGTVSNPVHFTNEVSTTGDIYLDGPIRTHNSYLDIQNDVIFNGNVNATSFTGDGSGLTGIVGATGPDTWTTGATVSGNQIIFSRNNATNYMVDLTPMLLPQTVASLDWDSSLDLLRITFNDSTYVEQTLNSFSNLSVSGSINATDVYATNFYGNFIGTLDGIIGATGATGTNGSNGATGSAGISITDITWSSFYTKYSGSTLVKGTRYKITDIVSTNAGPIAIWVDALDNNKISTVSTLEMTIVNNGVYNGDVGGVYQGVWSLQGVGTGLITPSVGTKAVWGGHLWVSTSTVIGTALDIYTLSSTWTKISKTSGEAQYSKKTFQIELNIDNSTWDDAYIRTMSDNFGNIVRQDSLYSIPHWTVNDWGDGMIRNNDSYGIFNNIIGSKVTGNIMLNNGNNNGIIANNQINRCFDNVGYNIVLNRMVDGSIYNNYVAIIGGNITSGDINNNVLSLDNTLSSNGQVGYTWGIYYNTFYGDITENQPNGDISYNTNENGISGNVNDGPIFFNSNNGSISSNFCNGISNNDNNGDIASNTNTGDIYNNSGGMIQNNSNLGHIYFNNAMGGITWNSNQGIISHNITGDIISTNSCIEVSHVSTGGINNNVIPGYITNNSGGDIQYNSNNGNITLNSSTGGSTIRYNSNGGNINNNDQGVYGSSHIQHNSNGGNINNNIMPTGKIIENSNRGDIKSNAMDSDIQYNTNNGGIESNTVYTIGFNSNNGIIQTNSGSSVSIYYNSNNGLISNNTVQTEIHHNSNGGEISYNIVYTIYNNTNTGEITSNTSNIDIHDNSNGGWITSNTNTGSISWNGIVGGIASNTNTGGIFYNTGSGNIYNNSNGGDIHNNSVNGGIVTNSTNGYITWNSIGGQITDNTQTSGTTNISWNNNNGNIGPLGRTGNILGTQVNL